MQIRYYHLQQVGSTNTWAKEHASEFALDQMTVITADEQTHGRGRFKRVWHSPRDKNLYLSLAFFISEPNTQLFTLCQLASITLEEFFEIHTISAKIKWPNDLLVNGKKIAGILTERHEVNGLTFVVIGIGLNANMTSQELGDISQRATSMMIEKNRPFLIEEVKESYVRLFVQRLQEAKASQFANVTSRWQKSLQWMMQQPVCVQTALQRLEGKVVDLHQDGGLILELPNGRQQLICSADLFIE